MYSRYCYCKSATNVYLEVDVLINGVLFATVNNPVNGISGTVNFAGYVTCLMGPNALVTQLVIVTNTTYLTSLPGPSTTIGSLPSYTFLPAQCIAYFTVPPNNPAQIGAAASYTPTIFSTLAFVDSYITLNGEFFCNIGVVGANSTGACTGFVPCYLPPNATFALMARELGDPYTSYAGPTVQLIPNASCNPVFAVDPQSGSGCPTPFSPLSAITFTFTINPNDSISVFSAFKINASNSSFLSNVFVADVAGPLTVINEGPSTYLIIQWLIPCQFNNAGATTFTLSYAQAVTPTSTVFHVQQVTVTIGQNVLCNLSLILNYPGSCPLPYNTSDCRCISQPNTTPHCNTCSTLSNTTSSSLFVPGDSLHFYAHNDSIPSIGGPIGLIANYQYYSSTDQFQYSFSLNFFYFSDTTLLTGAVGYKPIGEVGNATVSIPGPSTILTVISAFTIANVSILTSSLTGAYYYDGTGIYHTDNTFIPVAVPSGGPAGVILSLSGSNIDDSLVTVDNANNVWILTNPAGVWSETSLNYYYVANHTLSDLYPAIRPFSTVQIVTHLSYGPVPFFNIVPVYLNLTLTIQSSLQNLQIYSASIAPSFDDCNNIPLISCSIPASYQNIGNVTAVLTYTAAYPNGSTHSLSSSVSFLIGPTPIELLQSRSFCPAPCSSQPPNTSVQLNSCSSCQ